MTVTVRFAALLFAALLCAAPRVSRLLCRRGGLVKPNFRADPIPSSVGLTYLGCAAPVFAVLRTAPAVGAEALLYLLTVTAFGLLGLADDLWGSRAVGGFRGHLRSLFVLRPTTGALKLIGGGLTALLVSALLHGPITADARSLLPFCADALLIALAANALNLLDLRPGRAQFGFALLSSVPLLLALLARDMRVVLPLIVVAAAVREGRADAQARAMMGDTGSNLLGAAAGLTAALFLPLGGRLVLLVLLMALNLAAERVSLGRVIAKNVWLNSLDKRLGVR